MVAHYITMIKLQNALFPADSLSEERIASIKDGTAVKATITIPRNIKFHRLFFALLDVVYNGQSDPKQFPCIEALLYSLKRAMGYVVEFKGTSGAIEYLPCSIAFDKMDEVSFREFFDSAVDLILKNILPNCDKEGLEKQVFDVLNLPYIRS